MRINESRLRRIIREELEKQVDEMAYAGNLGIRRSPDEESTSFFSDEVALEPNRSGAEKFARSGRFKTLAEKHFANIPGSVWVAPLIGVADNVYDSIESTRVDTTPLVPDGIERLEELGYESPARVGGDDVVILYTTMSTYENTLATPWMIIHAMFDSGESMRAVCPSYMELVFGLVYGDQEDDAEVPPELAPLAGDYGTERWNRALTMRSAREDLIGDVPTDAFAEIMCQELLTKGGVRFDYSRVEPKYADALRALIPHVKRCADEFRRNIKGQLITVAVN